MPVHLRISDFQWTPSIGEGKGSRRIKLPASVFRSCRLKMNDWIKMEFVQEVSETNTKNSEARWTTKVSL